VLVLLHDTGCSGQGIQLDWMMAGVRASAVVPGDVARCLGWPCVACAGRCVATAGNKWLSIASFRGWNLYIAAASASLRICTSTDCAERVRSSAVVCAPSALECWSNAIRHQVVWCKV
jgi:hypothetical protein